MIRLDKCPICKEDNWKALDYLRNHEFWRSIDYIYNDEKVDMKICKTCAFVTYDYVEMDRLAENYDRQRPVVQSGNMITMSRKNEYHKTFLKDLIKPDWTCLDVGCAQGSLLNLLNDHYKVPTKNLFGTEFSQAFRDFGRYEYGLNITEEIPEYTSKDGVTALKYNFISYYHVLEHCQNPDKELEKARDLLDDNGYLYIAVPTWFEKLEMDSGSEIVNFEDLFHMNHVNCFTKRSLTDLLYTQGFEIIEDNEHIYGYTVLCQKADKVNHVGDEYKAIVTILTHQKQALDLLQQKKFDEAISLCPEFPDAYIYKSLQKDTMKDLQAQIKILNEGLAACPGNMRLLLQKAKIYFQWDENTPEKQDYYGNNIKMAEKLFKEVLENKSGNEDIYYFLGIIEAKYKKNHEKAVEYLKKCKEINPSKFHEVWSIIASVWKEKGEKERS